MSLKYEKNQQFGRWRYVLRPFALATLRQTFYFVNQESFLFLSAVRVFRNLKLFLWRERSYSLVMIDLGDDAVDHADYEKHRAVTKVLEGNNLIFVVHVD